MIFPYSSIVAPAPDGDDYILVRRPEIPITIVGPAGSGTYIGLVDTGSDNTILPVSIANDLGIVLETVQGATATVFGGHRVQLLMGQAALKLEADSGESVEWKTHLFFFEFAAQEHEAVILGHSGFLDYFAATFDGHHCTVNLVANADLPQ